MMVQFLRTGQSTRTNIGSDGRVSREHTVRYRADDNNPFELTTIDVLNALGLQLGSPLVQDPNATLESGDCDRLDTIPPYCSWTVALKYSTAARVPSVDSQDPTVQRVKRSKRYREIVRYIVKDPTGNALVNAAGQPFPGGVPVTDYPNTYVYEWARNVPTAGFHGTINRNSFNGCATETLLCLITADEFFEGAWNGWKETIEMIYNPLGWQPQPLNAGFKQLVGGILMDCTDGQRNTMNEAQPLYDGTVTGKPKGLMIPQGDRPGGCVFVKVPYYKKTDFASIGVNQFPY